MARGDVPKFTWGAAYANTLNIGYPIDEARAYSAPAPGSEFDIGPSGVRSTWVQGTWELLEGLFRWIPVSNTTNPVATGWDGATGFKSFLEWAWENNPRFFPDKDAGTYIEVIIMDDTFFNPPTSENDFTAKVRMKMLIASGSPVTEFTGY